MKDYELLDAMGDIKNEYIIAAANGCGKKRAPWVVPVAATACLCAVGIGAAVAFGSKNANPPAHDSIAAADSTSSADKGVFIPAVELPKLEEGVAVDMIGLVVYNGGIYTQSLTFCDDEARAIDSLKDEYLGRGSGSIDEWSQPEEYDRQFASNYEGEIYSVKGYDPSFRLCCRQEYTEENGESSLFIVFLDRLNGIQLTTGKDLFEDRLSVSGRLTSVSWQSHSDWNNGRSIYHKSELSEQEWDAFWSAVLSGEFVNTWDPDNLDTCIYDASKQAHIFLELDDGTNVELRLIDGGYVGYQPLGWYYVKIPEDVWNTVYNACGGNE